MILITGQLGYIGSHTNRLLMENGIGCIGIDNLHTGLSSNTSSTFIRGDIRNKDDLNEIFDHFDIDLVIHMAALTSVPESMTNKQEYIKVNTDGTYNLLDVMRAHNCHKLIFSSTASVYKFSDEPVKETDVLQPLNNYALTKLWAEQAISQCDWLDYVIFRYFNVIGYADWYDRANEGKKTNIVPALLSSIKNDKIFEIYGNNYPVKREDESDKTCVRDYIDVRDIANAHLLAVKYINEHKGCKQLFNLGTKTGQSVFELVHAFERANNLTIRYEIKDRRQGDPASVVADNTKAKELLGWQPQYTLEQSLKVL